MTTTTMTTTTMTTTTTVNKKINLNLIGLDGNAFNLMGAFRKQAKKEGWTNKEIESVLAEAQSKDYSHLLYVLGSHCESESGDDDYDDYDDDDDYELFHEEWD